MLIHWILEFDVHLFAVEDLIDSLVSPCEELLVKVEEIDREECLALFRDYMAMSHENY